MSSDADVLFGKIAMQLGLLTKEQIDAAIAIQELEDKPRPLGEILVDKRYLTQQDLQKILEQQKANLSKVDNITQEKKEDILFGKVAIREGLATADEVNECLREQAKIEANGSFKRLGELMIERGVLSAGQVQKILDRQKRRIMVCKGCKARYNVPFIDGGKAVKCPRCGGDVVLPTEVDANVQVEGSLDANATQVLSAVQPPPAPARPASPPTAAPASRMAAPAPGMAAVAKRPTVVMKSPFAPGGAGQAPPSAPRTPTPGQPQPAARTPTKTPNVGVPAVRQDATTKTPTAVPPPKPVSGTKTPTSVQRIMPAPGATSGIVRAVGGGDGPKKVKATCPICDHSFSGDIDPSTGRVRCPQCRTSFSPH